MKIACVTDEISLDVDEAITLGMKHGIFRYELRMIGQWRFPYYREKTFEALKYYQSNHGVTFTAASPGLFKKENFGENADQTYAQIFKAMDYLDIKKVIVFAGNFPKESLAYQEMLTSIKGFSQKAKHERKQVCIENSATTACSTGEELKTLLKAIGEDEVMANWDPGNAAMAGELDVMKGYHSVKGRVCNLHVKDVTHNEMGNMQYAPVGTGMLDYREQLNALYRDGYNGDITLETHCKPSYEAFVTSLNFVREQLEIIRGGSFV